jgi:hypothetical protein
MSQVETLTKQCHCRGTSSGPRTGWQSIHDMQEGITTVTVTLHAMVCDVCDKPWMNEPTHLNSEKCKEC